MIDWKDLNSAETLVGAVALICRPGADDKSAAVDFVFHCTVPPHRLSEDQKTAIKTFAAEVLENPQSWVDALPVCIMLSSVVGKYADRLYGSYGLRKAFHSSSDRATRNQLLFTLNSLCFKYGVDLGFDLIDMYFAHYNDWFQYIRPQPIEPIPGRCVIMAPQFLSPPHAPTVDTVAKYGILRDKWGYDVAILNSAERPAQIDLPVLEMSPTGRMPDYSGFQSVNGPFAIQGLKIFTPSQTMPSLEGYMACTEFIAQWRPEFILNYGGFHLFGEFIAQSVKTITMPAGTELLPTRTSAYDVVFHAAGELERNLIERFGMEKVKVIEAVYNYDMPAQTETYSRADFDLMDDDFAIAVVGNRLETEIDDENIALLGRIAAIDPRIQLVFAGSLSDDAREHIIGGIPKAQVKFAGVVKDVPAFYEHIDTYVNPKRTGGGSSAAFALGKGVPTFTLNRGHVADLTHPDFVFATPEDMLAAIKSALDPAVLAALRDKARQGFERIGSRERMVETILTGADVKPHRALETA
jgi:hypothetical protein